MTLVLINNSQHWISHSEDDKPTNPPAGSTVHHWNTGETFIYNGEEWTDDLRMIYAMNTAMNP